MSRFHYIGSATELPLGERGSVLSAKTYNEVKNSPEYKKQREVIRLQGIIPLEDIVDLSHLRAGDHLVYDSEEDAAGIFIEELGYWNDEIRKHFRSPFVYRISPNWGGFSDRILDLTSLSLEDGFELREKEYVVIKII